QWRLAHGDVDGADYYTRHALALSPESPRVLFDSLSLVGTLGIASPWRVGLQAVFFIPSDPSLLVDIVVHSLYPSMWALTIAAYVVYVLFCFFWLVELLRTVAHWFPTHIRGMAAPTLTFAILAVPIFWGPIACLLVWGLFVWLTDRRRRWPCLL